MFESHDVTGDTCTSNKASDTSGASFGSVERQTHTKKKTLSVAWLAKSHVKPETKKNIGETSGTLGNRWREYITMTAHTALAVADHIGEIQAAVSQ